MEVPGGIPAAGQAAAGAHGPAEARSEVFPAEAVHSAEAAPAGAGN